MGVYQIVEIDGHPGAVLYDDAGHAVGVVLDGSVYRLQSSARLHDGTDFYKATTPSDTQPVSAASLPLPTGAATETTLLAADGRLTTIDAVLDSIKDTDGIKKITDQLPAGTNTIGKVDQGLAGTEHWKVVGNQHLVDPAGNAVGIILDGTVYRLQTEAKVAKGSPSASLVHLDALDTSSGQGRLKATLYTPTGEAVSFSAAPPSPANIRNAFVVDGTNDSLLVNGSTPVVFSYDADATYDVSVQEIKFVLVSNAVTFGSSAFGATAGPLTNGVLVEIISNGQTGTIYNLKQNESFVNFSSPGGFEWVVSSKDMMSATHNIGGGFVLHKGTGDKVRVTVRDNIKAAGVYFKCFIKGNTLT